MLGRAQEFVSGLKSEHTPCISSLLTRERVITRENWIMKECTFLTPEEVAERYRGSVSIGTLRNWRAMRVGPAFVKIGKAVLYPLSELDAWDEKNMVACCVAKRSTVRTRDRT